jgi:hypothetical protein
MLLFHAKPGGALACTYCDQLLGFDAAGQLQIPVKGWPVFRYGRAELEIKNKMTVKDWRFRWKSGRSGNDLCSLASTTHFRGTRMLNRQTPMKLSPSEMSFLMRWMYDEAHFQSGQGPAKQLQVLHQANPADLALIIAIALPDPNDQRPAWDGPPPTRPVVWPWSDESLQTRIAEARTIQSQTDSKAPPYEKSA